MKKILLVTFAIILSFYSASAQSYTSAGNGNWTSPTTWTPMGVPVTFTDVTINHAVVLDTDFGMNSGEIIINTTGSLTEDQPNRSFVLYGGEINNAGTFTITNFWNSGGDLYNEGTIDFSKFLNESYFENNADLINVDSLRNTDEIYNYIYGSIDVYALSNEYYIYNIGSVTGTNYLNAGYLDNENTIDFTNITNIDTVDNQNGFYFNDFTNTGFFINNDYVEGSHDFTNTGEFHNYAEIYLDNDFLNVDSSAHEAYFYTEGLMVVGNNWLNIDTVEGNSFGQFCIENETGNDGVMIGDFDFCDQTPPGSAPYIDYNSGTIDASIVYCVTACGSDVKENNQLAEINIYPNPFTDFAEIEIAGNISNAVFEMFDITGQLIESINIEGNTALIQRENINAGLYFYTVKSEEKIIGKGKIVVQ